MNTRDRTQFTIPNTNVCLPVLLQSKGVRPEFVMWSLAADFAFCLFDCLFLDSVVPFVKLESLSQVVLSNRYREA